MYMHGPVLSLKAVVTMCVDVSAILFVFQEARSSQPGERDLVPLMECASTDSDDEVDDRESPIESACFPINSYPFPVDVLNMSFNVGEPKDGELTLTSTMLPSPDKQHDG